MSDIDTNLNNTEEHSATKNVRLKCDTEGESDVLFSDDVKSKTKLGSNADLPLAPAGKPSSATPSPKGSAPKTPGKKLVNYSELNPFIPENNNEENYALLTQYLLIRDSDEKKCKKQELIRNFDFTELNLQKAEDFFQTKNIPFVAKENTTFTFIDLFAGIGGFRLAMQANGGECVFSSEWDKDAKQTYYENYGEVPFGDITKDEVKAFIPEHFDVLCAGFPCQPFSNAGLKKGIEDTRGTLFYHIAEILKTRKPKVVLLENVRGLISNDNGNTFRTIIKTITSMGYKCNIPENTIDRGNISLLKSEASKLVLSAKDYGIPQNRPRIYIVLWRNDILLEKFTYPLPIKLIKNVGSILEKSVASKYTISDRLWAGHKKRRIENKKKGNGFGYCLFNDDSPYTSTLSRRYYKDGSEILIEQEDKNPRKITPRESARLQGFPDNFCIPKSDTKAYQQFGNSVAIPIVELIAKEIKRQILEK